MNKYGAGGVRRGGLPLSESGYSLQMLTQLLHWNVRFPPVLEGKTPNHGKHMFWQQDTDVTCGIGVQRGSEVCPGRKLEGGKTECQESDLSRTSGRPEYK